jgi:hypothetical protein
MMKDVPKREQSQFAAKWGRLLGEAMHSGRPEEWFDFFSFPKCILLAPVRGGKRISKSRSLADLVHGRLAQWETGKKELWEAVRSRGDKKKAPKLVVHHESELERQIVKALRMGDVRKALQLFTAAPIAPKTDETFQALQALHPPSQSPILPPSSLLRPPRSSAIRLSVRLWQRSHLVRRRECSVIVRDCCSSVLGPSRSILFRSLVAQ